jgi:hypothetical protein
MTTEITITTIITHARTSTIIVPVPYFVSDSFDKSGSIEEMLEFTDTFVAELTDKLVLFKVSERILTVLGAAVLVGSTTCLLGLIGSNCSNSAR